MKLRTMSSDAVSDYEILKKKINELEEIQKAKSDYRSNYYQQNKEKEREYHREWIKNNNEHYLKKRREDYKNRTTICDICNEIMPKYSKF